MKLRLNEKRNINLTEGSIVSGIIYFAIPLLLSNFLQQLYNTADLMIVGQFAGKNPMAAVGATAPIANLLIGLFVGLTTGASVVVSQFYGSMDRKNLRFAIHTSYAIAIVGGILLSLIGCIFAPVILKMMSTPEEIMYDAVLYMRIFFVGMVPLLVYNMGAAILRSVGDSRRPFNFLLISAIVNIVLDILFVAVFKMSVIGAGIATISSEIVSAILVTYNLVKSDRVFRLDIKDIKFYKGSLGIIFKIGIPTGIASAVISFSNVMIQGMLNKFGPDAIAGAAAEGRIDGFIFLSLDAIALAATTFSGQNFGAGKIDRIREGVKISIYMVVGVCFVLGALAYTFAVPLIAMFNSDPGVVKYGVDFMRYLIWAYVFLGISQVLGGFIRGSGSAIVPMYISITSMCILRLIFLYTVMSFRYQIEVIYVSYPLTWILSFIMMVIYYKFGNWKSGALRNVSE